MSCFPWELFPKYFSFVLQNCTLLSMERHCPVSQRSPWLNWGMGEHLLSPVSQHKVWPCPDCKPGPDLPTSSPSPFHILASIRRKGQRVGREELRALREGVLPEHCLLDACVGESQHPESTGMCPQHIYLHSDKSVSIIIVWKLLWKLIPIDKARTFPNIGAGVLCLSHVST